MGFFDSLTSIFSGHGKSAGTAVIGKPLTIADAKKALSRIVLEQPLLEIRATAQAVHEMEEKTPLFVTYSMDHYCNAPRLVRFQNSGGKQFDVDTTARIHAMPGVLSNEVEIQHVLGDIDDRRGHKSADALTHLDLRPLAERTTSVLQESERSLTSSAHDGSANSSRDDWLIAAFDQLNDMVEVSSGEVAVVLESLCDGLHVERTTLPEDDVEAMRRLLADSIIERAGSVLNAVDVETLRQALRDPNATTTAYMAAVAILTSHGLHVPDAVSLV